MSGNFEFTEQCENYISQTEYEACCSNGGEDQEGGSSYTPSNNLEYF